MSNQYCIWTQDEEGHWDTTCGHRFSLENGASPREHHMAFCCYCGLPLAETLATSDVREP